MQTSSGMAAFYACVEETEQVLQKVSSVHFNFFLSAEHDRCYEIDDLDWSKMNIDGGGEGVDGSHFRSALLIAVVSGKLSGTASC